MFQEDSRSAEFHDPQGFGIAHSRSHHEDACVEPCTSNRVEECRRGRVTEIVIQKHEVDGPSRQEFDRHSNRFAAPFDLYIRFGLKEPAQTLAEETVVVDQQEANIVHHLESSCQ